MKPVLLAVLLAAMLPAQAALKPTALKSDPRVGVVTFDEDEIVTIGGRLDFLTTIRFAKGEIVNRIDGGAVCLGGVGQADQAACRWRATPMRDRLTLLMVGEGRDTNLAVETTRRAYQFHLIPGARHFFEVRFRYAPESVAQPVRVAAPTPEAPPAPKPAPARFSVQGAELIAPDAAWVEGGVTHLYFGPGKTVPSFYYVAADGTESIANKTPPSPGDRVVRLHGVWAKVVLRLGAAVACVFRESP